MVTLTDSVEKRRLWVQVQTTREFGDFGVQALSPLLCITLFRCCVRWHMSPVSCFFWELNCCNLPALTSPLCLVLFCRSCFTLTSPWSWMISWPSFFPSLSLVPCCPYVSVPGHHPYRVMLHSFFGYPSYQVYMCLSGALLPPVLVCWSPPLSAYIFLVCSEALIVFPCFLTGYYLLLKSGWFPISCVVAVKFMFLG